MKIVCSILIFLSFSCNSHNKGEQQKEVKKTYSFPAIKYSKAKLFSLPEFLYNTNNPDTLFESKLFMGVDGGSGFIDRFGKTSNSYFTQALLDSNSLKKLQQVFVSVPLDSTIVTTNCHPVYRNAIAFYDAKDSIVAFVNLCFSCKKTGFYPQAPELLGFNDVENLETIKRWNLLADLFTSNGLIAHRR